MDAPLQSKVTIDEIIENFSFLEDWEDRYGYLIELGKDLTGLSPEAMNEGNKVQGCVSQVWLIHSIQGDTITFNGASDAHIVRGLVAIALSLFSGKTAQGILQTDENVLFKQIGLNEHITPQRANGLRSLVERIKTIARNEIG